MIIKNKVHTYPSKKIQSSTRDAVETAIDLSKEDKVSTWEELYKSSKKITHWESKDSQCTMDMPTIEPE